MKSPIRYYVAGAILSVIFVVLVGAQSVRPYNVVLSLIGGLMLYRYASGYLKEKEYADALRGTGTYHITYDELPTDRMLVGRGFMWTPQYTNLINKYMQDKKLLETGATLGGLSFIHGVGIREEKDVCVELPDLVGHDVTIGTTRVGKTKKYEVKIVQAIKRDETIIIMDPKGDRDLLNRTAEACRKYGRAKDFMFFALPYPRKSAYYNPLRNFTFPNEIPDRIAMLLPSGGASEGFRSFAWQVILAVTNALLFLNIKPTIRLINEYSLTRTEELAIRCVKEAFNRKGRLTDLDGIKETDKVIEYAKTYNKTPEVHNEMIEILLKIAQHPHEHFQKMTASLTPLLTKLATGEVGDIMSKTSDDGNDIDWERVVKNKKVVYMFFGTLLMRDTARAVIRMAIQDLMSFVGTKYCYLHDKNVLNLFIDEFTEVVDNSFVNLPNKAGGAGVRIYLASQSVADMEAELQSAAKAQQIFDNLNTKTWLRVTDLATAKVFSDAAGTVPLQQESSGASVSPDMSDNDIAFKSSYSHNVSEKSVPLIDPSWLLKVPKGQGFSIISGRVFKIRVPLLQECKVNYLNELGIRDNETFEDDLPETGGSEN